MTPYSKSLRTARSLHPGIYVFASFAVLIVPVVPRGHPQELAAVGTCQRGGWTHDENPCAQPPKSKSARATTKLHASPTNTPTLQCGSVPRPAKGAVVFGRNGHHIAYGRTVTPAPSNAAAETDSTRTNCRARLAMSVLFLSNGALFANLLPRYPAVKDGLDLSNAAFGAAFPLGALIAGLAAASLIRRFYSSRVAVVGTILNGTGVLLAGVTSNWAKLAAALFLGGAVDAFTDVAQNSHGLRVQRPYGRSILNSFHAVWSVGAALGGLLGRAAAGCPVSWRTFRFESAGRRRSAGPEGACVSFHTRRRLCYRVGGWTEARSVHDRPYTTGSVQGGHSAADRRGSLHPFPAARL